MAVHDERIVLSVNDSNDLLYLTSRSRAGFNVILNAIALAMLSACIRRHLSEARFAQYSLKNTHKYIMCRSWAGVVETEYSALLRLEHSRRFQERSIR